MTKDELIAGIEKKQKTIFEALEETNTKKTKTKKE
jgi:hypothetical protein